MLCTWTENWGESHGHEYFSWLLRKKLLFKEKPRDLWKYVQYADFWTVLLSLRLTAGVLSQFAKETVASSKHPVAFESRKLQSGELNYKIHDKELLAIIYCLQKWRAYLFSMASTFEVVTDHDALKYFMTTKVLTRRQARWAEFLAEFNFIITFRPGRLSSLPDALTWREDVYPKSGETFAVKNPGNDC